MYPVKLAGAAAMLLLLCACPAKPPVETACEASNPRDGKAWIDKMPGANDNPTLHVNFTVDSPNAADQYTLELEAIEKKLPPNYVYALKRTAGTGADVITETAVSFASPNFADPEVDTVKILCGGKAFLDISPVDIVQ